MKELYELTETEVETLRRKSFAFLGLAKFCVFNLPSSEWFPVYVPEGCTKPVFFDYIFCDPADAYKSLCDLDLIEQAKRQKWVLVQVENFSIGDLENFDSPTETRIPGIFIQKIHT